jgi:DNA helicase II / ATP-dependent DNA helicase PcrA
MNVDSFALDEAQRAAAFIDPEERQVVTAGPGAGKTEVVAALVEHLVEKGNLEPTEELLIISFSRAAIEAVRRRLRSGTGAARLAPVRTLDSLAAMALSDLSTEEVVWRGYDKAIVRATELIEEGGWDYLDGLGHLVVDEVQDVVGVRARLLLTILRRLPDEAGFTLLGDSAQALYAFSDGDRGDDLLTSVRSMNSVVERPLVAEYRSRSADAAEAAALRIPFLAASDDLARLRIVEGFLPQLPSLGMIEEEAPILNRWEGRTAILCRTNIDALLTAETLREAGVPVAVQRSARERSYASWIAAALGTVKQSRITGKEFEGLLTSVPDLPTDAETAWRVLRRTAGSRGYELDLRDLAAALASGKGSTELETAPVTDVVVSTVHRAKGLQFDNVVLIAPDGWRLDSNAETVGEDARTLYVAITRSRYRMAVAQKPSTRSWFLDRNQSRWMKRGRQSWQTFGFEIRGSDTRGLGPTSTPIADLIGRPVEWQLNPAESDLKRPIYDVLADSTLVARTTQEFGEALARRLGDGAKRKTAWPTLSGGHVESVETMAGVPRDGLPVGGNGLWLSARVTSAVSLGWKGDAE